MEKRLKSYVDAMAEASHLIRDANPDYLVAPMLGSVPLVDAMSIIDRDFDTSKVVYMPASSRIENINHVIKGWYSNFLQDVANPDYRLPKIMGIDEVVSGASVMRCLQNIDIASSRFKKALRSDILERVYSGDSETSIEALRKIDALTDEEYSFEINEFKKRFQDGSYQRDRDLGKTDSKTLQRILKEELDNQLIYTTIGIEDSKKEGERNRDYQEKISQERVIPVKVDSILTMDKPEFCTPKFIQTRGASESKRVHYTIFSPVVESFIVTKEYINFLKTIAQYIGINPDEVHPVNMPAIIESKKYLDNGQKS